MGQSHSRGRASRQAAERNDIEALLEVASADPRAVLRASPWKGRTPAHVAARAGSTAALAVVLDLAAHALGGAAQLYPWLQQPDNVDGDTALALAAKHGHDICVRELLQAGASPLPANSQGVTPLHYAAARGHTGVLRLLLTAPVRQADGRRSRAADAPVADVIDTERYVDTRTHAGLCALHLAVLCGSQAAVAELLNLGAQLDTPLLHAGFRAPALVPACLAPGSTALHMAAATGRAQLVLLLLHAQRTRHPGLELRRLRNARGMTALNVALLCQHRNLASLLTAGASIPAPLTPLRAQASEQLPPLLRQQLLALVHRAALLAQLRQLGLGSAAAAEAPPLGLAPGPVARLESLLRSDAATASQVLTAVDELLDGAAEAGGGGSGAAAPPAAAIAIASNSARSPRSRRRVWRRQAERQLMAQQVAAAQQAQVDWTLLERNRTAGLAAHAGPSALQRRLQRRRDQQHAAADQAAAAQAAEEAAEAAALAAAVGADLLPAQVGRAQSLSAGGTSELMLAGALLERAQEEPPAQQQVQAAGSSGAGSSHGAPASLSSISATAGTEQPPDSESVAAAASTAAAEAAACASCSAGGSQADSSLCPVCLDCSPDVSIAPCGHRCCLACCGRLASYCTSSSFGLPLQVPLCPLCRAPIEAFARS